MCKCVRNFVLCTVCSLFVLANLAGEPTVEVLYKANAEIGEGPFFEEETNQLLWVDINGQTINFLNLQTKENR